MLLAKARGVECVVGTIRCVFRAVSSATSRHVGPTSTGARPRCNASRMDLRVEVDNVDLGCIGARQRCNANHRRRVVGATAIVISVSRTESARRMENRAVGMGRLFARMQTRTSVCRKTVLTCARGVCVHGCSISVQVEKKME